MYFEHCFNNDYKKNPSNKSNLKIITNYNLNSYDVEHVTNIIISRIHEECIGCYGNCPSCKSFLIKGRIKKCFSDEKNYKHAENLDNGNDLRVIRLENWVISDKRIGGKNASVIKKQDGEYFTFELDELPNMIWYVLRYENQDGSDIEKILKMCMSNIKDNEFIDLQTNNNKCTYKLSIIVFHIKNQKDKYLFANYENDMNKWKMNDGHYASLDDLIKFVRIYQVKNEYFPAMLLYKKDFL
ncbi:hypothetical protein SteCoe_18717 [Stentor coeruleus]|uniref:Uncharacterized protein n=1 Tax=Stentor coeruleus TaxID=5963 RepID=A0A1R2BVU0_9CILI|nr:hypothetical protein SteCoe_18717 [Stentor coeruleus]